MNVGHQSKVCRWCGWSLTRWTYAGTDQLHSGAINGREVPLLAFEVEPSTWQEMRDVVLQGRIEVLPWRERIAHAWRVLRRGRR